MLGLPFGAVAVSCTFLGGAVLGAVAAGGLAVDLFMKKELGKRNIEDISQLKNEDDDDLLFRKARLLIMYEDKQGDHVQPRKKAKTERESLLEMIDNTLEADSTPESVVQYVQENLEGGELASVLEKMDQTSALEILERLKSDVAAGALMEMLAPY